MFSPEIKKTSAKKCLYLEERCTPSKSKLMLKITRNVFFDVQYKRISENKPKKTKYEFKYENKE